MNSMFRGIKKTIAAPVRIKKAKERYEATYEEYLKKYEDYKACSAVTGKHLEDLGQTRTDGMWAIREAVDFLQQFKATSVRNPLSGDDAEIQVEELEKLSRFYGTILESVGLRTVTSAVGGTGIGALAALGAYGLAGSIGVASTGTAISVLSGAAATNATLAVLGGGAVAAGGLGIAGGMAVLGGIVALPALIAVAVFMKTKADNVETGVEQKIQEIWSEERRIEQELTRQRIVRQRSEELQHTTIELIVDMKSALNKTRVKPNWLQRTGRMMRQIARTIIRRPTSGADDAAIFRVTQLARALRDAIDEPVLSKST